MKLPQQLRYARSYLRWFRRHQRRAYRLVRAWLGRVAEQVIENIAEERIEQSDVVLNSIVSYQGIRNLLSQIYQHTMPEAARREFDRISEVFSVQREQTLTVEAGFFSQVWQNTTARMLNSAETASRIGQIAESTRGQIRRILQQANLERLDVRATARRIQGALGGKGARTRALLIARTETTRAANAGHEAGAMSTSLKLSKIWIATGDGRTRDAHRAMLGRKAIPKDELFVVGGRRMRYPGDPAGGSANVINCRCTVAYVPYERTDYMAGVGDASGSEGDAEFTPAESVAEAEEYAKRFFKEVSYKGLSPEQANRVNAQLDKIYKELRLDQIGFKVGAFSMKGLRGNMGASTYNMGKTGMHLEKAIYGTRALEDKYVAKAASNLVLSPGIKRRTTALDPSLPSLEMTVAHEFGHQLDYEFTTTNFNVALDALGKTKVSELTKQISFYAMSPKIETWCELSAMYFTGHQTMIPDELLKVYKTHLEYINGVIGKRIDRLNRKRQRLAAKRKYGKRSLLFM
ncbi:phage minor head protein [Spirosoma fluminis]